MVHFTVDAAQSTEMTTAQLKLGSVPQYPFVNVPFDVQIFLLDKDFRLRPGDELTIQAQIFFEDDTEPPKVIIYKYIHI